jgi:phosphoribosylpyrophosphate synthetase
MAWQARITKFNDGEISIRIDESVRGAEVRFSDSHAGGVP